MFCRRLVAWAPSTSWSIDGDLSWMCVHRSGRLRVVCVSRSERCC